MSKWRLINGALIDVDFTGNRLVDGVYLIGAPSVSTFANVSAAQTESAETNSASLIHLTEITSTQTELSEINSASLEVEVSIAASQTESSESQSAAVNSQQSKNITAAQTEASETDSARFLPGDYSEAFFTVPLDPDSPFAQAAYSDIVSGDSVVHKTLSDPDGRTISITSDGIVNISGGILPQDQTVDFFIHDASDGSNGTPATLTIDAGAFISAPQIEASESNSAALLVFTGFISNVTAVQAENSEVNSADIDLLVNLIASQIENQEINSASIQNLSAINITSSQVEFTDTNAASVEVLLYVSASQTENSESNNASLIVVVPRNVTAIQIENSDINLALIDNVIPLEWTEICVDSANWDIKSERSIDIKRCQ